MVVSVDLIRFAPGRATLELGRLTRHLGSVRGAAFARPVGLAEMGTAFIGAPMLTAFGMVAFWPSAAELERFARRSPLAARWGEAREHLCLLLDPVKSHGAWHGRDPLAGEPLAGADDGPMALFTYARLVPAKVPAFARANPHAVAHARAHEDRTFDVGWNDVRPISVGTLSLWRSARSATRFAYGGGAHQNALKASRERGWFTESWFARMRPVESRGTWQGRDLLAELGRAPRGEPVAA